MLELDKVYTLTERDWDFKAPQGKSAAALKGLAIDGFVKRIAAAEGATIPENQFGPADFIWNGIHYDIKSTTKGSISISDQEMVHADQLIMRGGQMFYAIFEQLDENDFKFRGYIDVVELVNAHKIFESQYSGYYFTLNSTAKYLFGE